MRSRSVPSLLLAGTLAACASATPPAQTTAPQTTAPQATAPQGDVVSDGMPIRVGQTVSDAITAADPVWGDHGRFHLYRFHADAGDQLLVDLMSDDFDPYLTIGDHTGGIFNPLAEDDDGGDDLNSRVRFTAGRSGTYWIIAQTYSESDAGRYSLSLRAAPPPAAARPIAVGQSVDGYLEDTDAYDDYEQRFYDEYTLTAAAGHRYVIRLGSMDFDAYLLLGSGSAADFVEIARNDDGGMDYDSRIVFTPDVSGTYAILASSYDGSGGGAYTLSVDEMAAPHPPSITPLTVGRTVAAWLEESDQMSSDGSFYDAYSLHGREGQRIAITMRSNDLDSYLAMGTPPADGEEFYGDYTDDDSGGDLDSRIVVTLWRDGEYRIQAQSLYPDETGSYTITVDELPPPGPPSVRAIKVGISVDGELSLDDAVLDDNSYYDIYTFYGNAGQRVRITLTSDDFDAYLSFGPWNGNDIEITDTDDDSGGGLDSMLEITLPATGTYAIQANSLGSGDVGAYTVTLEEAP